MKLKIFYFLSVIIISFTLISCVSVPEKGEKEKPAYNYKTIEVKENLDYLDTNIKYPEFEALPELNKRIANTILSNWKSFKSYSKSEWNEIVALNNRGSTKLPPFEYMVTYEVSGSKNIVSVLVNTYIETFYYHAQLFRTSDERTLLNQLLSFHPFLC